MIKCTEGNSICVSIWCVTYFCRKEVSWNKHVDFLVPLWFSFRHFQELRIEEIKHKIWKKPIFQIVQANGGAPIRIPGKVNVFNCRKCGHFCTNKSSLENHQLRHSKERPFECWLCHKMWVLMNIRSILLAKILKNEIHLSKFLGSNRKIPLKVIWKPIFEMAVSSHAIIFTFFVPPRNWIDIYFLQSRAIISVRFVEMRSNPRWHSLCTSKWSTPMSGRTNVKSVVWGEFLSMLPWIDRWNCSMQQSLTFLHWIFRVKIEYQLKKHLLTHSEVPQFQCNLCDKAFRTNYSLKHHLQTHAGKVVKKFVCDYCSMGFRTNEELKVRLYSRIYLMVQPLWFKWLNIGHFFSIHTIFTHNNDVQDHRSMHTGEKRFKCEHCSSDFGARSSFYTHLRKVHGMPNEICC